MTNSVPALIEMLMQTTSKAVTNSDGSVAMIPDYDQMRYRLLNVPGNNYAAFLLDIIQLKKDVANLEHDFPTSSYEKLRREIYDVVESYDLSITGKSSEGGQLMKLLLQDINTNFHYFKNMSGGGGMMSKLGGFGGDKDREARVAEQRPHGGGN